MRAFVSIFLFLLFASQTFSPFVLDAMFNLNRNYVAQTLCENKSRPQLHCNGKCFLSKQIQKDAGNTTLPSATKKDKGDETCFFPAEAPLITKSSSVIHCLYSHFPAVSLSSYHHSLLRPPQVFFV